MPCRSELKQLPSPTTAILIWFIAGKTPRLAAAPGVGKAKVPIIEQMCGDAILGRNFPREARPAGLFPRGIMGILLIKPASAREMGWMRRSCQIVVLLVAAGLGTGVCDAGPAYTVDEAVATARKQNAEILMAAKQLEAAKGGVIEMRAGFLPGVVSTGLLRKRERAEASRLRSDDYEATLRVVQNLYTGGAITSQATIARLIEEKRALEYQALVNRVSMAVRLAFYDVLLNRAKIRVREQSVGVFEEELKTQKERLQAGEGGLLQDSRGEVALADEQP